MNQKQELELLRAIASRAEVVVIEDRREFARGALADVDQLEDALAAWKKAGGHAPDRTRSQWVARAYVWSVGWGVIVPTLVGAVLAFTWNSNPWHSSLVFVACVALAGVAWSLGCFFYGLRCVDRAYEK